jgi:hypothetical protein
LASTAALLRGLHAAARGFDAFGLGWSDELADPAGGTVVCHNDVCPENVVFRDGIAVALIDFEFAAPGRPVYDLAHLARLCVPIASKLPCAAASAAATRAPSRCGTGPVGASATTAGAGGGPTTATTSPRPSPEASADHDTDAAACRPSRGTSSEPP